jgi:cephalosporin hydroxylase
MIDLDSIYQSAVTNWGGSPTSFTDKGTDHDYINFYDSIFKANRYKKRLLEIGVSSGGSAWLWSKYFVEPEIYAVDIADKFHTAREFQQDILDNPHVKILWSFDSTRSQSYLRTPGQFDYVIDDGDHTPSAQLATLRQAWDLVKVGGYYFIEDIQDIHKAKGMLVELLSRYPDQEWKLFEGARHPQRLDDLIIYCHKK